MLSRGRFGLSDSARALPGRYCAGPCPLRGRVTWLVTWLVTCNGKRSLKVFVYECLRPLDDCLNEWGVIGGVHELENLVQHFDSRHGVSLCFCRC